MAGKHILCCTCPHNASQRRGLALPTITREPISGSRNGVRTFLSRRAELDGNDCLDCYEQSICIILILHCQLHT